MLVGISKLIKIIDLLNSIYKRAKSQNTFFDKLHNELIKNEIKVVILLNHGMKF